VLVRDVDVRHLLGLDQVLQPDFPRLAADLARHGVQRQLHREAHAGAGDPSVGYESRLVGGDAAGLAAVAPERIRPRQVADRLAGLEPDRERPHRIGAAIDRDLRVERQQLAAAVGIGGHLIVVLTRVGAGDQVFAAVLQVAERPPVGLCKPRDAKFLLLQDALVAERAADVRRNDPHLRFFQAEEQRQAGADQVRDLRGAAHHQLVGLMVPIGEHRFAFQGHHALAREIDLAPDHDLGAGGQRVEIAVRAQAHENVVFPAVVQRLRTRALGADHVGMNRKLVVVDFHRFEQVFRVGPRGRVRHHDRLADETDLAMGERRLRRHLIGR
jgi:hypothetical protein